MTKRILVVEDQEDNRRIIRDMLTFTDYEIAGAESGEQALEAVAKQRPDPCQLCKPWRVSAWPDFAIGVRSTRRPPLTQRRFRHATVRLHRHRLRGTSESW
jgi:hypothetical protein